MSRSLGRSISKNMLWLEKSLKEKTNKQQQQKPTTTVVWDNDVPMYSTVALRNPHLVNHTP